MSYKAIILPLAKQDIRDAAQWYNARQRGLGKRFTKEIRRCVKHICKNPEAFALRYENTRTCVLDVFPFMIHYTPNPPQKTIIVSAVLHTSRNPETWGD